MGTLKRFLSHIFGSKSGKVTMAEAKSMAQSQNRQQKRSTEKTEKPVVGEKLGPGRSTLSKQRGADRKRRRSLTNAEQRDNDRRILGTARTPFKEFGTFSKIKSWN